jgi:Thioredoxin
MVITNTTYEYLDPRLPPSAVAFVKIDTDKCADIAQKYNVRAMPTFIFIKDNNVVETVRVANIDGFSFPHSNLSRFSELIRTACGVGSISMRRWDRAAANLQR